MPCMVVYLMVGDLADPAAEDGLAWGVRREEPNRDAHGLAAFFFLEWIGGTAMILFFFPSFILGNSSMEQGALGWVQFGVGRA
jgi:hypothetical protein